MIKIMDFSMWIQSPSDWGILFLSALLIGMSKTDSVISQLRSLACRYCDY